MILNIDCTGGHIFCILSQMQILHRELQEWAVNHSHTGLTTAYETTYNLWVPAMYPLGTSIGVTMDKAVTFFYF